jgi:hypothetical protein
LDGDCDDDSNDNDGDDYKNEAGVRDAKCDVRHMVMMNLRMTMTTTMISKRK